MPPLLLLELLLALLLLLLLELFELLTQSVCKLNLPKSYGDEDDVTVKLAVLLDLVLVSLLSSA